MTEIIITPNFGDRLTESGIASQELHTWLDQVTSSANNSVTLSGAGSPEGVVTARLNRWYVDTAASPADVYFKATDDNTNTGWVITS